MITFLAPLALAAAAVGTVAITVLHFLSVRRPPIVMLPTARFVVARDIRAVSRSTRPTDVLLLLIRVLALWCAALAIAGPRWTPSTRALGHIIVADIAVRADSLQLRKRAGVPEGAEAHVKFAWTTSGVLQHELGAAMPAAWQAAQSLVLRDGALDSVALHVVVPYGGVASTDGWAPWRASWPGRVQTVRAPAPAPEPAPMPTPTVRMLGTVTFVDGESDDVLRAAYRAAADSTFTSAVVVRRSVVPDTLSPNTAVVVGALQRRTIVVNWPTSGVPPDWRPVTDTSRALVVGDVALVAPWTRHAAAPDSMSRAPALVLARWSDGLPAAIEHESGDGGCSRDVAVAVPANSDLLLSPSGAALVRAMFAPCGSVNAAVPARILDDSGGMRTLASVDGLRAQFTSRASVSPPWLPAVLLGVAMALLMIEVVLRRTVAGSSG